VYLFTYLLFQLVSKSYNSVAFCRAMLRISAVYAVMWCLCACPSVCLSVRPSVTFVDHVKTNKHIFEIFSPSGSHTILVFPYQRGDDIPTGTPLTGASNAGKVGKKRDSGRISSCIGHLCIGAYSISTA